MKKRVRISLSVKFTVTFVLLVMMAMLVVALTVQRTVRRQFTIQYQRNVHNAVRSVQQELLSRQDVIQQQLNTLADKLGDDTNFRLHVVAYRDFNNAYIVNFAQNYMETMGLQALEIWNTKGVALSLGQYKTAFGLSRQPLLQAFRVAGDHLIIVWFDRPTGSFPCLAALDSVEVGGQRFFLVGGIALTTDLLQDLLPDPDESLVMAIPTREISSTPHPLDPAFLAQMYPAQNTEPASYNKTNKYSIGSFTMGYFSNDSLQNARVFLFHPTSDLVRLITGLNHRILGISGLVLLVTILVALWRAEAVIRPLKKLVAATRSLSLERLDAIFPVRSNDEVGQLNDTLQQMVKRLRQNRVKLAEVEQKASLGEIARQVNHDIKNGIIPIRNVMRHWEEVEHQNPEELIRVFSERKSTIQDSLEYLQTLTENYSRLRPKIQMEKLSLNQVVKNLLFNYQDLPEQNAEFQVILAEEDPMIMADHIQLRRALENILRNALDAISSKGTIIMATDQINRSATWICQDDGPGIPEEIQSRLFKSPVTTKRHGTGLGLANTRRIIEDFDGRITVDSSPETGTKVTITLPLADPDRNRKSKSTQDT